MASSSTTVRQDVGNVRLIRIINGLSQKRPLITISGYFNYLYFQRTSKKSPGFDVVWFSTKTSLGQGSFGAVFLATNSWGLLYNSLPMYTKNKTRVIKVFDLNNHLMSSDKPNATLKMIRQINREVIVKEYRIARAAGYLGVKPPVFTANHAFLVMKRLPGVELQWFFEQPLSLVSQQPLLREIDKLDVKIKLRLTYQLLLALKRQVTDKKIIHRDIKRENILVELGQRVRVFIIDFGLARFSQQRDGKFPGTLVYVAPEIIFRHASFYHSDVFSLARVISALWLKTDDYFMVNDKKQQIRLTVNAGQYLDIQEFPHSEALKSLLLRMLQKDARQRCSINEALLCFARHFPDIDDAKQIANEIVSERRLHLHARQQRVAVSSSQALAMASHASEMMPPPPQEVMSAVTSMDTQNQPMAYALVYGLLVLCVALLVKTVYNRYGFFAIGDDGVRDDYCLENTFTS